MQFGNLVETRQNSSKLGRGQWRSQGAVAAVAPRTGQRRKLLLYQWFILHHNHILSFYEKRSVAIEYADKALRLDPTGIAHNVPTDRLVGWGGDTPHKLHPNRRRRLDSGASGARICPFTHNFWLRHLSRQDKGKLVANCVHTADTDKTKTRQFSLVCVGGVNKLSQTTDRRICDLR